MAISVLKRQTCSFVSAGSAAITHDCNTQEEWPIPIRNEEDYLRAQAIVDKLAVQDEEDLSEYELDQLEVLTIMMETYEKIHYAIKPPDITPVEFLKKLMESSGMSESDLGRLLGDRSLGHKILHGERQLSKSHIKTLSEYFKIDSSAFL